jgi:hypothetical protein
MDKSEDDIARKGLIDAFNMILELDRRPDILRSLPKKSLVVRKGGKIMFVPMEKKSKTVVL